MLKKWIFTGIDGCGDVVRVIFDADSNASVTIGQAHNYNPSNDTYTCNGVTKQSTLTFPLFQPFVNGQCIAFCAFGSGVNNPNLVEACPNGQLIECARLTDGYCCISNDVIFDMCSRLK